MCRTFRKYCDRLVTRHCIPKFIYLISDTQFVLATDKYRVVDFAKPSNQWPAFNPVICNKSAAGNAGHHRNINPAMMVCGVEDVPADPYPFCCCGNATGPANRQQEKARPWGIQPEKTPNIVKHKTRYKAARHHQQPEQKQDLPGEESGRIAPFNPCGRWQRRTAPYDGRPNDNQAVRQ